MAAEEEEVGGGEGDEADGEVAGLPGEEGEGDQEGEEGGGFGEFLDVDVPALAVEAGV